MQHKDLINTLAQNLEVHLESQLPKCDFSDVSRYGVLPPGKLFRPMLAANTYAHYRGQEALEAEISNPKSPLSYFCSGLEIHHAYTLMHDDLPCMDDDDYRRGKESTHIKFGEWRSLLAADGLINASYALWARIEHPNTLQVLKLASWALGPRGLILGQALDLGQQMNQSFQKLIWTHQLKTGRLIQLSILGATLLSEQQDVNEYKRMRRFSEALGLAFQLIDDLTELCEPDLNQHEKQVNPWPQDFSKTLQRTALEMDKISQEAKLHKDLNLDKYFQLMNKTVLENAKTIENHLGKSFNELKPVMTSLKRLS